MSTRLNFRTRNKTIFWSTLVTPKSINKEEFNQPGHSVIQFISSTVKSSFRLQPKRLYTTRSWTDNREPRHKTPRGKACDLFLSMRHVFAKILRKHTCRLNESKDPYLRSITHIHTHLPMYVSKDKIFIFLSLANYWPIYFIDFY